MFCACHVCVRTLHGHARAEEDSAAGLAWRLTARLRWLSAWVGSTARASSHARSASAGRSRARSAAPRLECTDTGVEADPRVPMRAWYRPTASGSRPACGGTARISKCDPTNSYNNEKTLSRVHLVHREGRFQHVLRRRPPPPTTFSARKFGSTGYGPSDGSRMLKLLTTAGQPSNRPGPTARHAKGNQKASWPCKPHGF